MHKNISQQHLTDLIAYQIYPRSYQDTSGDGVGDLKGITQRLDHLEWLGVSVIWLSPFYPSPMADFGYDVSDYTDVDPLFGTLDDFKELQAEANKRGIKIIIDFVLNHTSDQHEWFLESKSSRDNPKRDWYIWADPKEDGSPPNNWQSVVEGSVWEFDKTTGQYYLHSFLKDQPDLNWNNPEVVKAMQEAARFWLDIGVSGFRLDAVPFLGKDLQFRDEPLDPNHPADSDEPAPLLKTYSWSQPEFLDHLSKIAEVTAEYEGAFIVAEYHTRKPYDIGELIDIYQDVKPNVLAPFNFSLFHLPFEAKKYKSYLDTFHAQLPEQFVPMFVLGNHDETRIASRVGQDEARMLATMLLTLPGLPYIYYGDELGMEDAEIKPDQIRDTFTLFQGGSISNSRDPERTPMQWDNSKNAGFSSADETWLPLSTKPLELNVKQQKEFPDSMLNHYRTLIQLRNNSQILRDGSYLPIELKQSDMFAYKRSSDEGSLVIAFNFSEDNNETNALEGRVIYSTHDNTALSEFKPLEAKIISLD